MSVLCSVCPVRSCSVRRRGGGRPSAPSPAVRRPLPRLASAAMSRRRAGARGESLRRRRRRGFRVEGSKEAGANRLPPPSKSVAFESPAQSANAFRSFTRPLGRQFVFLENLKLCELCECRASRDDDGAGADGNLNKHGADGEHHGGLRVDVPATDCERLPVVFIVVAIEVSGYPNSL